MNPQVDWYVVCRFEHQKDGIEEICYGIAKDPAGTIQLKHVTRARLMEIAADEFAMTAVNGKPGAKVIVRDGRLAEAGVEYDEVPTTEPNETVKDNLGNLTCKHYVDECEATQPERINRMAARVAQRWTGTDPDDE